MLRRRRVRDREGANRHSLVDLGTCLAALGLIAVALGLYGFQRLDSFSMEYRAAGGCVFLVVTGLFLGVLGILRVRQGMRAGDDREGR